MPSSPLKEKYGFKGFPSRNGRLKDEKAEAEGYDNVSQRQLSHCLRSLESKPQSWTSYSNGRQNAFAICRAVRTEIEKDELLALHKEMTGVTSILSSTLSKVLDESGTRLTNQQTFSRAVQRLQTQVLRDLENTESMTRGFFDKIKQDANSIVQAAISKVLAAGRTAEASINILGQRIRESDNEAKDLQKSVSNSRELAHDIQSSLQQLVHTEMQNIFGFLQGLQNETHALREMVARVSLEHITMGELMSKLGKGFDVLDARTESLSSAQAAHAVHLSACTDIEFLQESQSRLHEGMNASINALRGSILGATEDVVLVKSIANETYAKLKEMGIFFHLGGIIMSRWGWLVVILIGVAMASRRAAGFIAISAGFGLAVLASGLLEQPILSLPRLSSSSLGPRLEDRRIWIGLGLAMLGIGMVASAVCIRPLTRPKVTDTLPMIENVQDKLPA
ncbi:MAG: hypothetical protein M1813_000642 [Trichoglossum hirsutum]|nr:MAG: hypothetical protein M1813_000642 [Trichoglossum hirsutum]